MMRGGPDLQGARIRTRRANKGLPRRQAPAV
jgi:hypothetical protein